MGIVLDLLTLSSLHFGPTETLAYRLDPPCGHSAHGRAIVAKLRRGNYGR
jgi:hypothetical protein